MTEQGTWLLTMKPSFLIEWGLLPAKEVAQIQKKLTLLSNDPTPDAKVKKPIKKTEGKVHRIRSGDYRIFYTFDEPYVSLLSLKRKNDSTYDEDFEAEHLGAGDVDEPNQEEHWKRWLSPPAQEPGQTKLAQPVTADLLNSLKVSKTYHESLLKIETEDDLFDCEAVPEDVRLQVAEAIQGLPFEEVTSQPDLILEDAGDLLKYRSGELLDFLLKLNPTQKKFVTWASNATGPTLLKGGPGTGKSTVALHRVRTLIKKLRDDGVERPRILFTTYTNALIRFSEQQLQKLLGPDSKLIDVRTADSVAVRICIKHNGQQPKICQGDDLLRLLGKAISETQFPGNALVRAAQRKTIERLETEYLLEEITGVIEGRRLSSLEEYQQAVRSGRKLPLNKTQRQAVWLVRCQLVKLLEETEQMTWEQVRVLASDIIEKSKNVERYDAVLIDEAQDLSPGALGVLVRLCAAPNRLFLTADANQSIYGAGFRWSDVHEWLKFKGRTGVLVANHRSTQEIGEAGHAYLTGGELDDEELERQYVHSGPLPAVRAVESYVDEQKLLARFFKSASRELRLGLGSCAVLCPTNASAKRIADALVGEGLKARFMSPKELDLKADGVKTITLKSAKGLEFPIVALAGFLDGVYPYMPKGLGADERTEIVERERRTMFVAMTRAMRALLVVAPSHKPSELLRGFTSEQWNLGG